MTHQIWHAFFFDDKSAMPARSEVIEATSEEDAARQARDRLGACARVCLESASWTDRKHLMIEAEPQPARPFPTFH